MVAEHISFPIPRATAYLVAVFKLDNNVPVFLGVDIFSEPDPSMGGDRRCFVVEKIEDVAFSKAKATLVSLIVNSPRDSWLAWVRPHYRERGAP